MRASLFLPVALLGLAGCVVQTPPTPTTTTYVAPAPAATYVTPTPTATYVAPAAPTTTTVIRSP
jgi:hypothetical protein